MLCHLPTKNIHEPLPRHHPHRLPHRPTQLPRRYNAIRIYHLLLPLNFRKPHPWNPTRIPHESDGFADGANGFAVSERLADPVDKPPVFAEGGYVCPTGDEECVEEGGTHAFDVVVWGNAAVCAAVQCSRGMNG